MHFDPITGEPIEQTEDVQQTVETTTEQVEENTVTPETSVAPTPKRWLIPGIIGAVTVVVAVVAVIVVVAGGLFLSPANKVAMVAGNTFEEAGILGDMLETMTALADSDERTSYMMMDVYGSTVEAEYRHTKTDKQLWVAVDVSEVPEIEATATITDKELQLYAPILGDYQFFYNYIDTNTGALVEEMGEETVELLNEMLKAVYELGSTEAEVNEEFVEAIQEWISEIEFEELDKEEFEIDDKKVSCAGYEVEIDKEMLCDFIDICAEFYADELEDADSDEMKELAEEMQDAFEEMKDELDEMPDVTVSIYLHANMLAAIIVEVDGYSQEMEILFQGGDYRAQNITVKYDGTKILRIKGKTEGNVETVKILVAGTEYVSYEYNKKNGDFELVINDESGTEIATVEANIVCNDKGIVIKDAEVSASGASIEFECSLLKGAKIEKLKGERFDVGNASLEEIQKIVEELQEELY